MIRSSCRLGIGILAVLLMMSVSALAQDYRGKVHGSITDENGAALAGAHVVLRNVQTGVEVTRSADQDGRYVFDFIEPGDYVITAEQQGFKKAVQENVIVRVRGDISVDLKLSVGGVQETVTVESPPVAVQFGSSSTQLTIENKVIDQLPIRGRNPYNVATLDPTVSPGTGSTSNENRPYHHAYASDIDVGGQTTRANDVLLDGVPLVSSYKSSYTPALDAVQEVTFQKNAVDSEYGYSAGGVIVLNMKSGTNTWHGTAIANWRNPRFNAVTDPTLIRTPGADETNFRGTNLKIYGGTIGGSIIKNKLFTFTSYEHWNDASPLSFTLTVPTALERTGDFSQSSRKGLIRDIFDPATAVGTSGTRTQFKDPSRATPANPQGLNIIPMNRFDPTALKLLQEMPLPNLPGSQDNLQGFKVNETSYWNFSERVDWNYSEKWRTFIRYGQFKAVLLESNPTEKLLLPVNGSHRYGMSIAADSVYTISPKWVFNIRANYHQLTDEYAADPALIGKEGIANLFTTNFWESLYTFPQYYYPAFDVGPSSNRIGRPGREFWQHPQGYGGSARMSYYQGAHTMKFGGEYRVDRGKGARFEPLTFNIKQAITANANSSPNLNTSGSEWATFMLGYLDNASIAARVPIQEAVTLGYAGYFMDDYKVNSRLTLNLGLRWEYEPGPVDRGNRLSQQLDLTKPIPEMQTTPPAIPATVTNLLASKGEKQLFNGAWIFTSADNRHAWNRKVLNLLPRLGGAYRISDNSVFRFGWGRYISPSSKIRDPLGDFVNQYSGFSTSTPAATLAVVAGGPTGPIPRATLSNPFPAGITPIQQPLGQSLGRYTNLGNSIGAAANATNGIDQYNLFPSVNDRFSFSYQREIWGHFILDLEYFYNHEKDLPYAVDLNMIDPAFSYEVPKSTFNQSVANPFFNYLTPDKFPGTLRTQSTITLGGLLRPYPQYGVINQTNTSGRGEHLHSFEVQVQRPFTRGLSVFVAYAYQREQTQEFFDDLATFARRFEWRDTDTPRHRVTSALTWDLPVGKGRQFLKDAPRAVDLIVGGWTFTTSTRIYSGRPLFFNQNLIVDGNPKISNPTNTMWFDITKFHPVPTSADPALPPNLHKRDNPWTFDGLYGPSVWQSDLTMSKSFRLTERFKLEARVEAYNVFNRIQFANPTTDFTSTNFGKITAKLVAYNGREVQYGLRLVF
jgi:hypothetical protein